MKYILHFRLLLTALFLAFAASPICAQDTLLTVAGDFLPVNLIEIQKSKLIYTTNSVNDDSADVKEMPLDNIFQIKLRNGLKQSFSEHLQNKNRPLLHPLSDQQITELGKADAYAYFASKPRGLGVAAITLLNPPAGLIVALTTNSSPYPNTSTTMHTDLVNNQNFIIAYRKEGKRIKKGKAMRGFVAGMGAYLFVLGIMVSDTEN